MVEEHNVTRRELLRVGALAGAAVWLGWENSAADSTAAPVSSEISDELFLEEVERARDGVGA